MRTQKDTYNALADKWWNIATDWQGRWFIYFPAEERELERLARLICYCYDGMAEGRRSRYRTLDSLKAWYAHLEGFWEGLVDDARRLEEICARCNEMKVPEWELPEGEHPCACGYEKK